MYHVEISAGFHRARVFNLDQGDVMAKIVQPWLEERAIEMGDREWKPRESSLRILEGPELSVQDLAFSRGWSNAERASTDVTVAVLESATEGRRAQRGPATIVINTDSAVQTLADIVSGHDTETVSPEAARERIDGRDPAVAAVILVVQRD